MATTSDWRSLDIAVVGGGIGGLCAGISLRRAGHKVTIYEKADYAGEVGASISCAANGTQWLHEWNVDVAKGDPVVLQKLINRDWTTGEPVSVYDLADYEERWGHAYNMFHRQHMHAMLMECAQSAEGDGIPVQIKLNHKCADIDTARGLITFAHGAHATHDAIVGADGIGSRVRELLGIRAAKRAADSSCLHANVATGEAVAQGLVDYSQSSAIEYWGGHHSASKIVLSPCNGGSLLSFYCFFPRSHGGDYANTSWDAAAASVDELLAPFPDLDPRVRRHLRIGRDIRPWRLWLHEPYAHWQRGVACLLGDAAHPMMPDQSQGACMAIEDAACLGLVFGKAFWPGSVREALCLYERVRKPRATKVQAASARARENIHERIGFSDNTSNERYDVKDESNKLTIAEMNGYDMRKDIISKSSKRVDSPLDSSSAGTKL